MPKTRGFGCVIFRFQRFRFNRKWLELEVHIISFPLQYKILQCNNATIVVLFTAKHNYKFKELSKTIRFGTGLEIII